MRTKFGNTTLTWKASCDTNLTESEQEELRVRYFRAAHKTIGTVLETVVAMVYLTCQGRGFPPPLAYCHKHLKWKQSFIKHIFTPVERESLNEDPNKKPYDIKLNIKLLTRVWTWLGKDVSGMVRKLEELRQSAIYNPPSISCLDHLYYFLKELFHHQEKLAFAVGSLCNSELKKRLAFLTREKIAHKRRLEALEREVASANIHFHLAPIHQALASMELMYLMNCVDEDRVPSEGGMGFMCEYHESWLTLGNSIEELEKKLETALLVDKQLRDEADEVQRFCIKIIKMRHLCEVGEEINEIANTNISSDVLTCWHEELKTLQRDTRARLEALGKFEILSFGLSVLTDVFKWLRTKTDAPLHVTKIYSRIKLLATNEVTTLQNTLNGQIPQVITIYGPVGSGKTCLSQYLFNEWRGGSPSIVLLKNCQLLVLLKGENVHGRSFVPHIKKNLFRRSLGNTEDSEVLKIISQFEVLFVVDASSGVSPDFTDALKELLNNLCTNSVIITARLHKRRDINELLRSIKAEFLEAQLQSLSSSQVEELCVDYMKIENTSISPSYHTISQTYSFQPIEDKNTTVRKFVKKLTSQFRDEGLLYPLSLTYLLMLWLEEPGILSRISTVSQLFEEVIKLCRSKISVRFKGSTCLSPFTIEKLTRDKMEVVYEMAVEAFNKENSCRLYTSDNAEVEVYDLCRESLFPLLVCCGSGYGRQNHQHKFLHHSVIEVLTAWATSLKLGSGRLMVPVRSICRRDLPKYLPLSSVKKLSYKYVNMIQYLCGFLTCKQRAINAAYIVAAYKCAGVKEDDFPLWISLLDEGSWSEGLVKAVSEVLNGKKSSRTWKVPVRSFLECQAVPQLVGHRAYRPQEVLVTTQPPKEVITMLASQPHIDVRILPEHGYHGVNEAEQKDAVLCAIREAGNVTELWGKLDEKGAVALASMTRLHTLNVYLTSLAALHAFSKSIRSCSALKHLFLYLDLPANTPPSILPALPCSTHTIVHLVLSGINDSSWEWAADVTKQLGCRYEQLVLLGSSLSPTLLHSLKEELHPTPVHASR